MLPCGGGGLCKHKCCVQKIKERVIVIVLEYRNLVNHKSSSVLIGKSKKSRAFLKTVKFNLLEYYIILEIFNEWFNNEFVLNHLQTRNLQICF